MFQAIIIADSISPAGIRMTTFELVYPRFIHAECKTHRLIDIDGETVELIEDVAVMNDPALSRNASSSRAIPTRKLIEMVRNQPVMPVHWGKNQPGMQAKEELGLEDQVTAQTIWLDAADNAADFAEEMLNLGVHKQIVNRILEPYLPIRVVASATDWANFYALRRHEDAQPEIKLLADLMWDAQQANAPKVLAFGEWHLPYVLDEEIDAHGGLADPSGLLRKISTARGARVSYRTHDGRMSAIEEDLRLYDRLICHNPMHASPAEHQATPDWVIGRDARGDDVWAQPSLHGNLNGWVQHRKTLPFESVKG